MEAPTAVIATPDGTAVNGPVNGHINGHARRCEAAPGQTTPLRFNGYHVRVPVYEGPLDLLLFLVKQNRYDIFDIPIARITGQYLHFVRLMEMLNFELAGDFLVVAAELLVIKSKLLLPPEEDGGEPTEEGPDPRLALAARLLEYQRFKEAAAALKDRHHVRARMFHRLPRVNGNGHAPGEQNGNGHANGNGDGNGYGERKVLLMNEVSLFDLLYAFQRVLDRAQEEVPAVVRRDLMTVPERIREIAARIRLASVGLTFAELCDDCHYRIQVIITFLALLELIRRQRVSVEQSEIFGDIRIARIRGSVVPEPLTHAAAGDEASVA